MANKKDQSAEQNKDEIAADDALPDKVYIDPGETPMLFLP